MSGPSTNTNVEDVLARLPSSKDSDEVRITKLLESELLRSDWARTFFKEAKDRQIEFIKNALGKTDKPDEVYKLNQELLRELSLSGRTRIESGSENLEGITAPVMIVTNHLGDYKLAAIKPEELKLDIGIDQVHPFSMYYSPYYPIAEKIGAQISAAHVELPEPLYQIEKACALITIVAKKEGGTTEKLEFDTRDLFNRLPNSLLVVFPEGGTSGKRNGKGPYDLEEFKAGAFVIAGHLGIPILPVAKYFNPEKGYELAVFPSIKLDRSDDRSYYKKFATETQEKMQVWLNSKKTS